MNDAPTTRRRSAQELASNNSWAANGGCHTAVSLPRPGSAICGINTSNAETSSGVGIVASHGQKRVGQTALLVSATAVLAASYLAVELIGKGVLVHFLVLILYGAVFLTLGAVFLGKQHTGKNGGRDSCLPASSPLPTPDATIGNHESALAAARTPPLSWVGETVEGSVKWLRGSAGAGYTSAGGSDPNSGAGAIRRQQSIRRVRSRSDTGERATAGGIGSRADLGNGGGSAATSPGGGGGDGGELGGGGFPILSLGRAAAATAELALGHTQRQLGRARGWSRTFGTGGVGGAVDGSGDGGSGGGIGGGGSGGGGRTGGDTSDEGEYDSLEDGTDGGNGQEWMVGGETGNESESGSLSSMTTGGWHGDSSSRSQRRGMAGSGEDLNWEVDGRRQLLRRSSLNAGGAPTEDNIMVQDLLEMISDAPVDHAGQWRPVRVRRGIHIWTSTVEGSPYCRIRGRMRCEATPAQLLALLIDDERIAEYDWMFDRYELVERPNDHTSVRWTSYRAIWPTRPRDFVIRSTWEEFADGTIVISTRSVEHEDYPETPTFVRGKMVTCGYVICPLGESRRRRRSRSAAQASDGTAAVGAAPGTETGEGIGTTDGSGDGNGGSSAAAAAAAAAAVRSPEGRPSSEFTMYAHTDLGGNLPASVINKLCKKPAYRVLRKIQDMIATDTLVKRGEAGEGGANPAVAAASAVEGAGGVSRTVGGGSGRLSRHDSEDVLGSLLAEGMPDRDAAANLEHVPEGEMEGVASGTETEPSGSRRRASASSGGGGSGGDTGGTGGAAITSGSARRGSSTQQRPTTPSPLLPGLSREFAISEAQRIMQTVNRMASDDGLGWSQLGVAAHKDMALYKSPVAGTKKVRLGASTCVSALPSELVGILLENAAMLGPDYIVDRQELLETFSSGVGAGEGEAEIPTGVTANGGETQHDTAIYWFSCTHKRQRICRDFVILRCFRPLPGRGAVIAYSSVDHPGLPPCPDYVRGKLDVSGFVIVPSAQDEEDAAAAAAMAKADELRTSHSDDEHGRRNGPRQYQQRPHRKKRRSQRTASAGVVGGAARRRSRSSASANASGCTDSEDSEGEVEEEPSGTRRGRRTLGGARGIGISEVTFFTHLKFSAHLPDFQEMEACRHFVGPLHILQELKWVVERTLGSFQEDEVLAEAAAQLQAGRMGGGADWGNSTHSHARRKSITDSGRRGSTTGGGAAGGEEVDGGAADAENSAADELGTGSGYISESESAAPDDRVVSNAVILRVPAKREAMLRDMLAFSSDGEGMDGPQVDWRLIKQADGVRLWRAQVPGTVWCMIRTRTPLVAPPQVVLDYLLDESLISTYDELFDKIQVIEAVDSTSTFKRTCYKPIWPTAPRDFSLLSSWGSLEDGTCYLLNRSVDHPMNPPIKGYVRGVVMLCGFLMVPRSAELGGGCTMTMIVHTDLGGSLPASILNHLSTNSPWRLVQRLRSIFAKDTSATAAVASNPSGEACVRRPGAESASVVALRSVVSRSISESAGTAAAVAAAAVAQDEQGRAVRGQGQASEGASGGGRGGERRREHSLSEGEGRVVDGMVGRVHSQHAAAAAAVVQAAAMDGGARGGTRAGREGVRSGVAVA